MQTIISKSVQKHIFKFKFQIPTYFINKLFKYEYECLEKVFMSTFR